MNRISSSLVTKCKVGYNTWKWNNNPKYIKLSTSFNRLINGNITRAKIATSCENEPKSKTTKITSLSSSSDKLTSTSSNNASDQKDLIIEELIKRCNVKHGKGSVMMLGDPAVASVETVPSGSLSLDAILGGGYPLGRIIEIYGQPSSGKTTLAIMAMVEMQRQGKNVAFIDVEHALDADYAKALGLDADKTVFSQPDYAEQAMTVIEDIIRSDGVSLVCLDSVSALLPLAEFEGNIGDQQIGLQARLMSQSLRKLSGSALKHKCSILFINQLRNKIGILYGNPEVTSGGNALKYYASLRLEVKRIKSEKEDQGILAKIKVSKNKIAPPFGTTEIFIQHGHGINKTEDILKIAEEKKIVDRSGSWYRYETQRLGQGSEKVCEYLNKNPQILNEIETKVRERLKSRIINNEHISNSTKDTIEENNEIKEDNEVKDDNTENGNS